MKLKNESSESKNNGAGKYAKDEEGDYFLAVHVGTIAESLPQWRAAMQKKRAPVT
jgi:hypothetical protein